MIMPRSPRCGTENAESAETQSVAAHEAIQSPGLPDSFDEGRFQPGKLLAERYRIIGLIGRGGMGEVYRATDIVLGQAVALKFLPESTAFDERTRRRFYQEVRLARRISHPNVCRVYDIGTIDGILYISMEYVDGEDLSSLLRRIGRLPGGKAVEIARQLCAGLAAAHAKGILHRDLKPSNIMINGRGEVVITDFGLAGIADQIQRGEIAEGTPGYMAPEQMAGKEISARSDLYALGSVLYEMFTGKRAFEARSRSEMKRLQTGLPETPSSIVKDLDSTVERVILRCLAADPRNRPSSAVAVATSLPGRDPLSAALALGQTPSPETVAAAGEAERSTAPALLYLCAVVMGLLLWAWLAPKANLLGTLAFDRSPETLRLKAHDVLQQLGYVSPALDSAAGLTYSREDPQYVAQHGRSRSTATQLRFWYRQSAQYLVATDFLNGIIPGVVSLSDPPAVLPGMTQMELDTQGRLMSFEAIPAQYASSQESSREAPQTPDWDNVFTAAGLDRTRFKPVEPEWAPSSACDLRAAWTGTLPNAPELPLRLEVAAWHGKVVHFLMVWPWTQSSGRPYRRTPGESAASAVYGFVVLTILLSAALLARKNARAGRGDQRGAFRVAAFLFALTMLMWVLAANHVPGLQEFSSAWAGFSAAIAISAVLWVFYVAFEPYVRRHWPRALIGWSRLLTGSLYDPLVGKDLLTGTLYGIAGSSLFLLVAAIEQRFGAAPPLYPQPYALFGGGALRIAEICTDIRGGLLIGFSVLFLMFLLRMVLRSQWTAAAVSILIFTTIDVLRSSHPIIEGSLVPLAYTLSLYLLLRHGLLAFITGITVNGILNDFPITLHFSMSYAREGFFAVLVILAIASYGYHAHVGGRPVDVT